MEKTVIKQEWLQEQEYFKNKIFQNSLNYSKLRYIAGVDVAYTTIGNQEYGCCSIVIIDYKSSELIYHADHIGIVNVPYHPGYLSYRELPVILETVKKLEIIPDVYVFDGNGILHPKKMGIATHASFYVNKPCIGVAKNFFHSDEIINYDMPDNYVGACTNIFNKNGEILGIALRTKINCKPVFVSVGNYISLEDSKTIIMNCINNESRIPIPTRMADIGTHKIRRKLLDSK